MPDYNLGRAHGEIVIDADTRGAQEAQAAMAATAAEAEVLDKSMAKVNRQFDENRRGTALSAEQLVRQRGAVEELRKTYERFNNEYLVAAQKRVDVENRLKRARDDETVDGQRLLALGKELQRAKDDEQRTLQRMDEYYQRYQTRLSAVRIEIQRFNEAHLAATTGIRATVAEMERMGRSLELVQDRLSGVVKILAETTKYGLFGGAAGGALGLTGAGGLQSITTGVGGIVEIIKDFSGAMLLIPGVVNGAVLSLGTLATAFHGVGAALSSLEDPAKFSQALRDMAPAAQQAMLQLAQFTYAFRGARMAVQESLFEPIINDIKSLVMTWLPQLMNAGQQIANQFGQAFHQVFQFFQQPEVIRGFQIFVNNLVQGFSAARGAIQPFLQAWNTLAQVGSGAFERLGRAVATVAKDRKSVV